MFPPNDMLGVLIPESSEYDLIWREGLYTGKGRSRVCFLIQSDQRPHKEGKCGHRGGHTGRWSRDHEGRELGGASQSREVAGVASNCQKESGMNRFFLTASEGTGPGNPWSWTSQPPEL